MESPTEAIPDRLGEFAILGILGRGGTGVVYAASRDDRPIALKVLRDDQVPTGKERQRFITEAEHMAKLQHPGIVKVYGAGELDDGRPYLAMERLHGENLAQRLASGTLPRERALDLFRQLAAAVETMHASGLIHRDLKPENVMLVDDGKRAVLLDFGIARAAEAPPSTTTQAGFQRGTPAYMAPERFFGARATTCSDLYELGVILYVMLCGRLPWDNPLDAKARLAPKGPSAHGVEIPSSVERALMCALSSNEDERPASAKAFADDVQRAAWETAPTQLVPPAPPAEVRQRSRVGVYAAAAAVVVVGALGMTLWLVQEPGATGGRDKVKVARRAKRAKTNPSPPAKVLAAAPTVIATPDAGVVDAAPNNPSVVTGKRIPECRELLTLYCNAEYKNSEGGMSGALCRQTTKNVVQWEARPPSARAEMADECKQMFPGLKSAVDEHLRQFRAGAGPATSD